jgi:putative PIN family toxin of toxin-antitoxin system
LQTYNKVVLDTNVVVSAMLSPGGNPSNIMALALDEKIQVFYSQPVRAEYEESFVLAPRDFIQKFKADRVGGSYA